MNVFKLPDLGEGLPDAEIHEWHVKVGDTVELDQPLVSMETAKALVEVPAPRSGTIAKLYGKSGDIIKTDNPLVEFTDDDGDIATKPCTAATVAGNIEVGDTILQEAAAGITVQTSASSRIKVIPALRALAKRLGVDLSSLQGTGPNGRITAEDIKQSAATASTPRETSTTPNITGETQAIRGVRRAMVNSMVAAHRHIVPTTIVDDADISMWSDNTDFTVRVIQAIAHACQEYPALNAHFDGDALVRTLADTVNIGLALDSPDGLFVPVIKAVEQQSASTLREIINRFKQEVKARTIPTDDLQGATISLSNFGVFAGRYANPIIVPPAVAIIGIGRSRQEPVAVKNKVEIHMILPISLTFDHRAVTGGEASRFLGAMINYLSQKN